MPNPFHKPVRITQPYGPTTLTVEPAYGDYKHFHRGIDVVPADGERTGAKIYSMLPGYVFSCGTDGDGAIYVIVRHDDGTYAAYWHLNSITTGTNRRVTTDTQIGTMGSTGNSSGPHLHLELLAAGSWRGLLSMTPLDPTSHFTVATTGASPVKEQVTYEEDFRNCYITQAGEWPTAEQVKAWQQSGLEPYAWVQRNAPNPSLDEARRQAFREAYIAVAWDWPTAAQVAEWQASGQSIYEWVQQHAPNQAAMAKEAEIRELHIKLEKTEVPPADVSVKGLDKLAKYLVRLVKSEQKGGDSK